MNLFCTNILYKFVSTYTKWMQETTDFKDLLDNLKKGLKIYSVKDLNKAILSALNKKHDKKTEIDFVLKCVSEKFSISVQSLKQSAARGRLKDAKETAYCLLHFDLGLSQRHISQRIFGNWPTCVNNAIKRYRTINSNIKTEREFQEGYQLLQERLIKHISEQEK